MNDKPMQALEAEMAPILAAFSDEIVQNPQLFARIKAVYDGRQAAKLDPDQLRLVETIYEAFARNGAALDDKGKKRLKDINAKLASLYTKFSQNELHDEETGLLLLESEADLAGLPDSVKQGARDAAEAKQHKGKWAITNTRSSVEPFLTYSTRRDLREKAWRMWISRGDNAGAHDNKPLINEILKLREEKAKLLGYASHAHWIIADNMAKTPDAAMGAGPQGVESGGRPRARRGRRHAEGRRPGEGEHQDRSPGTTGSMPRRSARRSTTSTPTR